MLVQEGKRANAGRIRVVPNIFVPHLNLINISR